MYYPYLRGKQNELILLRENAELISKSKINPIIEPVKSNLNPLVKTINRLIETNCKFTLILNPSCGDFAFDSSELIEYLQKEKVFEYESVNIALLCDGETTLEDIKSFLDYFPEQKLSFIHNGFTDGKELEGLIRDYKNVDSHIFIEPKAQKRYRKTFNNYTRILIRDGFVKRSNKDHPVNEHFSELHIMYEDEGMNGFGDFLINGDEYSESGGPAYAVAIHITYLDDKDEDDMFIKHYISDRNNSPADPGGKFLEALNKLVNDNDPKLFNSKAVDEFKKLADRQHFPGLGSVKKLSMQHHLELVANFLK